MRIPRKLRFFQASRFSEEAGAARSPRAVPIARRPGSALALPGSARASRRRLLRLSLPHCPRCPCCLRAARAAEPNLESPLRTWPAEGPRGQRRPAIDGQSRGVSPSSEGSAASSPIQANDSAVSADVTVSVEPTVGSTSVTFKYKLTNDSAQTVWAVHSPAVSVMPASGRKTGVVAAMALSRSQGRQLRPAAVRGRCQA